MVGGPLLWKVDETRLCSSSLRQGNSKPCRSHRRYISTNNKLRLGPCCTSAVYLPAPGLFIQYLISGRRCHRLLMWRKFLSEQNCSKEPKPDHQNKCRNCKFLLNHCRNFTFLYFAALVQISISYCRNSVLMLRFDLGIKTVWLGSGKHRVLA